MSFDEVIFLDDIRTTDQLIGAFHAWLERFDAVDDEQALLRYLSRCQQALPTKLRVEFGLPPGASYATAAELFQALWFHVDEFDMTDES